MCKISPSSVSSCKKSKILKGAFSKSKTTHQSMKSIIFFTLIFPLFLTPKLLKAQELFICDDMGNIGKVNFANCSYKAIPLNNNLLLFLDITFHPNGKLYGYLLGKLFEIDTIPNSTPRLIAYNDKIRGNSLTSDKNGIIYGAGSQLWSYNVATNQFKIHGDIMADNEMIQASGDLTFYNGNLYVSTSKNKLVQLNIEDPTQSTIFLTFSSQDTVFGIMSYKDCDRVRTFATTNDRNARILEIDWKAKTTKPVCNLPVRIYGAASEYEFLASVSDTTFAVQYTCNANKIGVTTQTLKNGQNCDSIVTTKLIYAAPDTTYATGTTCEISKVGLNTLNLKTLKGCDSIVVTHFTFKNEIKFSQKISLCGGKSLSVGDTILTTSGIYIKRLKNTEGCDSIVTTVLTVTTLDLTMSNDTVINLGDSVKLIGLSQTTLPVKWQWTPSTFIDCDTCITTWAKPATSTVYRLTVYDSLSKCRKEGIINVKTKTECDAYIPTAFSPNDDGVNDKLMIYMDKCVKRVKRFALFSRWGNPIIQTDYASIDSPREIELWNGMIDGKIATSELYVYFVEVEYINGQTKIISGDTTVFY
jgi:hypothetical protein